MEEGSCLGEIAGLLSNSIPVHNKVFLNLSEFDLIGSTGTGVIPSHFKPSDSKIHIE